jgi:hypothetical protein
MSTDHKAPRYVVFSTSLLPRPSRPKYLPQPFESLESYKTKCSKDFCRLGYDAV